MRLPAHAGRRAHLPPFPLMMMMPNFDYSDWEDQRETEGLTAEAIRRFPPPDAYRWRGGSFARKDGRGIDQNRSQAIRRSREKKRMETNRAYFEQSVLPAIGDRLNAAVWKDLGYPARGGFVLYRLGDRQQWIHPQFEPELIERAKGIGAVPV